ncbi:MAG TPA: IclR family transcriptional regulator C-terminal domain-containing protein [Ramlibacter sp.]|nr:IclR family transcriptional regulator C-terminal domain-containing protein [Ramlibacter sp.]
MSSEVEESPDFVRALARGLSVIECFDENHRQLTLSEVAKLTDLSRPSARRALLTLEALGYVRSDGDRFSLTARTLRLGYAYLSSEPLWTLAQPYLVNLRKATGRSCSIAVLDGDEIVFVARAAATRITHDEIGIGLRWPAYATSMGRVLLSGLAPEEFEAYLERTQFRKYTPHTIDSAAKLRRLVEQVRQCGWAYADQEMDSELRSISVPLRDRKDRIVAAMNTAVRAHQMDAETLQKECLAGLQEAAAEISAIIKARPAPRTSID